MTIHRAAVPAPTRGETITDRLREEILAGAFAPGTALREIALAGRYHASRQTIREALRALAELGLVEVYARRGAVIPKLSPLRAREVYTLRALVEPFALRLAMVEGRIKSAERAAIEAAFAHMRECAESDDMAQLIEADMAFHWALCAPSNHQLVLDLLERLQASTRQSMVHMKVYGSDAEGEVETHTPVLHAVREGDAEGASIALRDHITQNGERLLMKLLEAAEDHHPA
jgi:DNA-binding GntR family transcriptional regulator